MPQIEEITSAFAETEKTLEAPISREGCTIDRHSRNERT